MTSGAHDPVTSVPVQPAAHPQSPIVPVEQPQPPVSAVPQPVQPPRVRPPLRPVGNTAAVLNGLARPAVQAAVRPVVPVTARPRYKTRYYKFIPM